LIQTEAHFTLLCLLCLFVTHLIYCLVGTDNDIAIDIFVYCNWVDTRWQ